MEWRVVLGQKSVFQTGLAISEKNKVLKQGKRERRVWLFNDYEIDSHHSN